MTWELVVVLLFISYNLLLLINIKLENYIENKVLDRLQIFYEENNIVFDTRGELIMEALTYRLISELKCNLWLSYVPVVGIISNLKSIFNLDNEIDDYIYFLRECYGDLLKINVKEIEEKESLNDKYFISIPKNDKYLTIWFTYIDNKINIIDASNYVKSLAIKEQYNLLYEGLNNLKSKNREINCSRELEKILDELLNENNKKEMKLERIK